MCRKSNIEAERVRRQLTMEDLASKLNITAKTYSNYVRGITPIPSDVLYKMSELFDVTIDYLLGVHKE